MTAISTALDRSSSWEEICFPVKKLNFQDFLPDDYQMMASDRMKLVVGEYASGQKVIFANQSSEYTVIPNSLLRDLIEKCFKEYTLQVLSSKLGEFSITVITPDEVSVGKERLYKSLILNNSYSGKSPFTIQGSVIESKTETKAKVSYYRQICSNGLMGWADEWMSLEDYFAWLAAGQPKKKTDLKVKSGIEEVEVENRRVLLSKKFSHRKLDLEWFESYLTKALAAFVSERHSLTPKVYRALEQAKLPSQIETLLVDQEKIGLPKMMARAALERMEKEEKLLQTSSSLWLLYNGINYALFNARSSLNISDRYALDQKALHQLASLTLS